jgi:hypothetical protein
MVEINTTFFASQFVNFNKKHYSWKKIVSQFHKNKKFLQKITQTITASSNKIVSSIILETHFISRFPQSSQTVWTMTIYHNVEGRRKENRTVGRELYGGVGGAMWLKTQRIDTISYMIDFTPRFWRRRNQIYVLQKGIGGDGKDGELDMVWLHTQCAVCGGKGLVFDE